MIPYAKIAALAVAFGLGYLACLAIYARPQIDQRDTTIAQMKEADAISTSKFLMDSAAKDKEYQDERTRTVEALAKKQDATDHLVSGLNDRIRVLNGSLHAYASGNSSPVPTAAGATCPTDRSENLAGFLDRCNSLLVRGISAVQTAANQITALQEACK